MSNELIEARSGQIEVEAFKNEELSGIHMCQVTLGLLPPSHPLPSVVFPGYPCSTQTKTSTLFH